MAFKMNNAPFQKKKPGHIPPYEKGDDLKERFLARRASKTEGKFEKYLDESGSVESPKGDRLAIKANKAADAHQKYTDKRAAKAVAKRDKRLQPGEHSDTAVTGGSKRAAINDLEDRIEFLKGDIAESKGGAKYATMKKSLSKLQAQLLDIKNK